MGFRGFNRRQAKTGGWFSRLAAGDDATPVFPPLYIAPSAAPTATARAGDIYVDTNGVLQVHNGTSFTPGGGGEIRINVMIRAAADHISQNVFVADRAYRLLSVEEAHVTASTSGTLTVRKCTGTQAPSAGTNMLTSTISTAGTANTTVAGTLSLTDGNRLLADGDRLALETGGTVTNIAGAVVTIVLRPV